MRLETNERNFEKIAEQILAAAIQSVVSVHFKTKVHLSYFFILKLK